MQVNIVDQLFGTKEQMRSYFQNNIKSSYVLHGNGMTTGNLVKPDFFNDVGGYVLAWFYHQDVVELLDSCRSLKGLDSIDNEILKALETEDVMFEHYGRDIVVLTEDLAKKLEVGHDDLVNKGRELLGQGYIERKDMFDVVGTINPKKIYIMNRENVGFGVKYDDMRDYVQNSWNKKVCEKSIFPTLDRILEHSGN